MHNEKLTSSTKTLKFRYRNYKGEVGVRTVIPLRTVVKCSPYHNDGKPCWIMEAYDQDKESSRDFALADIIEYYNIL